MEGPKKTDPRTVGTGTGGRVAVLGESIKLFPAGQKSSFEISAPGVPRDEITIHIVSEYSNQYERTTTCTGEEQALHYSTSMKLDTIVLWDG